MQNEPNLLDAQNGISVGIIKDYRKKWQNAQGQNEPKQTQYKVYPNHLYGGPNKLEANLSLFGNKKKTHDLTQVLYSQRIAGASYAYLKILLCDILCHILENQLFHKPLWLQGLY